MRLTLIVIASYLSIFWIKWIKNTLFIWIHIYIHRHTEPKGFRKKFPPLWWIFRVWISDWLKYLPNDVHANKVVLSNGTTDFWWSAPFWYSYHWYLMVMNIAHKLCSNLYYSFMSIVEYSVVCECVCVYLCEATKCVGHRPKSAICI